MIFRTSTISNTSGTPDKMLGKQLQVLHAALPMSLQEAVSEILGPCDVALTVLTHVDDRPAFLTAVSSASFTSVQLSAGVLYCSEPLARLMVDRLLGGQESVSETRPLSELEQQLWMGALPPILQAYAQAWERHCGTNPSLTLHETAMDEAGPFYLATYQITSQYGSGDLTFVLRLPVWRELLTRGGTPPSDMLSAKSPHTGLLQAIGNCSLTGRAVLGSTTITVHDLLYLQPGDIICLGRSADAPVEIRVGAKTKAYGKAHVDSGRLLVTVERTVAMGAQNGPQ